MTKLCKKCDKYPAFAKGYCRYHQYLRDDIVKSIPKKKKKEKHTEFGFRNQTELFNHIWNTREHKSELSGGPLLPKGHEQWHWQFLHILSKGTYAYYKLNPDNILLGTVDEHNNQNDYDIFNTKWDELNREYHEKYYNKKY